MLVYFERLYNNFMLYLRLMPALSSIAFSPYTFHNTPCIIIMLFNGTLHEYNNNNNNIVSTIFYKKNNNNNKTVL